MEEVAGRTFLGGCHEWLREVWGSAMWPGLVTGGSGAASHGRHRNLMTATSTTSPPPVSLTCPRSRPPTTGCWTIRGSSLVAAPVAVSLECLVPLKVDFYQLMAVVGWDGGPLAMDVGACPPPWATSAVPPAQPDKSTWHRTMSVCSLGYLTENTPSKKTSLRLGLAGGGEDEVETVSVQVGRRLCWSDGPVPPGPGTTQVGGRTCDASQGEKEVISTCPGAKLFLFINLSPFNKNKGISWQWLDEHCLKNVTAVYLRSVGLQHQQMRMGWTLSAYTDDYVSIAPTNIWTKCLCCKIAPNMCRFTLKNGP